MTDTPIRKRHWEARELVLVGVFAAAAKLSSLLIALAGGGMNPVSLVAKNLVYTHHCAADQSTQTGHAAFVYGHQHDRKRVFDGRQPDAFTGGIGWRLIGRALHLAHRWSSQALVSLGGSWRL
mgnify:CR=1 FL=1